MNVKSISVLIAIGLVIGVLVGFPVAKVYQGVKTVTKTKTVPTKIENGMSTDKLVASLGSPLNVLTQDTKVTLPKGCATYAGTADQTGNPKWILAVCAFTR